MRISRLRLTNWKSFIDTDDLALGQINVIVGRNNSGKSAVLRAILMMQTPNYTSNYIRLGEIAAQTQIVVALTGADLSADLMRYFGASSGSPEEAVLSMRFEGRSGDNMTRSPDRDLQIVGSPGSVPQHIPPTEPHNFIYPYLSKRKVAGFGQQVDQATTNAVNENLGNLVAKIDRLINPDYFGFEEYSELCKRVLGFRVSTYASGGKQAGISIGRFDHISIEEMGEGVSSLLGLITNLCMADGHLFLIEEPENDIHPESLKALLNVIVEKSKTNQFIVTTHSNIVTRYLGAAENSKLFVVEAEFTPHEVPTSTIREVEPTPDARIAVLRDLGYELADFDLWDGWLILEEASAELFIHYLIPWFVPQLSRVRTVSAGGTSKVMPTFEDYRRLFLFAHLESQYKGRAWVVVDGDQTGVEVVEKLKETYKTWPPDRFRTLSKTDFEYYYPAQFAEDAATALALKGNAKQEAKKKLRARVSQWCEEKPVEAKAAFEQSASEVTAILKEIEGTLFTNSLGAR